MNTSSKDNLVKIWNHIGVIYCISTVSFISLNVIFFNWVKTLATSHSIFRIKEKITLNNSQKSNKRKHLHFEKRTMNTKRQIWSQAHWFAWRLGYLAIMLQSFNYFVSTHSDCTWMSYSNELVSQGSETFLWKPGNLRWLLSNRQCNEWGRCVRLA